MSEPALRPHESRPKFRLTKKRVTNDRAGDPLRYPPVVFSIRALAAAVARSGLSRNQLARMLGLTPLTTSRVLSGCDTRLSVALRLADIVGAPVGELWRLAR